MYAAMQQNAAQNPNLPGGNPFLTYSFARGALIGGIAFSSAILGVLVGFRDRFLKAAAEAARSPASPRLFFILLSEILAVVVHRTPHP